MLLRCNELLFFRLSQASLQAGHLVAERLDRLLIVPVWSWEKKIFAKQVLPFFDDRWFELISSDARIDAL